MEGKRGHGVSAFLSARRDVTGSRDRTRRDFETDARFLSRLSLSSLPPPSTSTSKQPLKMARAQARSQRAPSNTQPAATQKKRRIIEDEEEEDEDVEMENGDEEEEEGSQVGNVCTIRMPVSNVWC
jgi:hypothetical protein